MSESPWIRQPRLDELELIPELTRRLRAGQRNVVEQLLGEHPGLPSDEELLVELIYREFVILDELGEPTEPRQIYDRFPHLQERLKRLLHVHWALGDSESDEPTLSSTGETNDDACSNTIRAESAVTAIGLPDRIGNYELIEEIGHGGMGIVYKARQQGLDRIVAVKVIQSGFVDRRQRRRFFAEAETAAKLQHANIVQIHEVGEEDGTPFLSMQFIDGQSLEQIVSRRALAPTDAARLVKSLADTVHFAHQNGVIHRDLKPGNVLLADGGTPMITDFGLATNVAEDEDAFGRISTIAIVGTPSYMAPEQAELSKIDPAPTADVYGLGATLYELLTGKPPFVGTSVIDTIAKVKTQPPLAPRKLSRNIPRDLETICLKCLEKPSLGRYQSACALGNDLQRFLENRPIRARRTGPIERSRRWAGRHPLVASLSLALALSIVAGIAAALWQWNWGRDAWVQKNKSDDGLQQQLYFNRVALAYQYWSQGNIARAETLLKSCEASRRGWEWNYLNRIFFTERFRLTGHRCKAQDVEFSPDGKRLASCGGNQGEDRPGEILIWNAETGKLVHRLEGHANGVMNIEFSPDGSRLVASNVDWMGQRGAVKIWNVESGELAHRLPLFGNQSNVFDAAFDPQGKTLALAGKGGEVRIWDLVADVEKQVLAGHTDSVLKVAFHPSGKLLASAGSDGCVRVWDPNTGKLQTELEEAGTDFLALEFSSCGRFLAAGGYVFTAIGDGWNGGVWLWEVAESEFTRVAKYRFSHPTSDIQFSPDGQQLAVTDAFGARLIDTVRGTVYRRFPHEKFTNSVCFSPNGRRLATSGGISSNHVKVWDLTQPPQELKVVGRSKSFIRDLALHPNGRQFAIVGYRRPGQSVSGQRTVEIWDLESSAPTARLSGTDAWMTKIDYGYDGLQLGASCQDGTVLIWDLENAAQPPRTLAGHQNRVNWAAFHPKQPILASGGDDECIILWNSNNGKRLRRLDHHGSAVTCLEFGPEGDLLFSCDRGGSVTIWNVEQAKVVKRWTAHAGPIEHVTISRDGKRLVTSGADDRVKIWSLDAISGQRGDWAIELKHAIVLERTTDPGFFRHGMALSPDGERLAAIGTDRLHFWDLQTGKEAFVFSNETYGQYPAYGEHPSNALAFHPHGHQLIVTHGPQIRVYQNDKTDPAPKSTDIETWHDKRFRHCRNTQNKFGVKFHLDQLIEMNPQQTRYYDRAKVLTNLGDTPGALRDLELAVKLHDGPMSDGHARAIVGLAVAQLADNQIDKYRSTCRAALSNTNEQTPFRAKNNVVWTCLLSPQPGVDYRRCVEMAQMAVDTQPDNADYLNTLGVSHYRAGEYLRAIEILERAAELRIQKNGNEIACDWIFLAMAHRQLNHQPQSRQYYEKAKQWISKNFRWDEYYQRRTEYQRWQARRELELFEIELETMFQQED